MQQPARKRRLWVRYTYTRTDRTVCESCSRKNCLAQKVAPCRCGLLGEVPYTYMCVYAVEEHFEGIEFFLRAEVISRLLFEKCLLSLSFSRFVERGYKGSFVIF